MRQTGHVTWRWHDNTGGRGLDTTRCTTSSKSIGEGLQTLTATCQDSVGNVGTANYTIKVDKTGPTLYLSARNFSITL
ncbi:MAG: hypothetical protein NT075_20215 [Chloroflexi bacterium]|nr:hypothetical protein [Chloroflexota bacterium]